MCVCVQFIHVHNDMHISIITIVSALLHMYITIHTVHVLICLCELCECTCMFVCVVQLQGFLQNTSKNTTSSLLSLSLSLSREKFQP